MSGHAHAVNAAVNGLSALPGTATPFACARAMTRFLNNPAVTFAALLDPVRDAVRDALAASPARTALVVHDWSMFNFRTHAGKKDKLVRTHAADAGYELASALAVDAADGRPLGPVEFRLRTAHGTLTTRPDGAATPPGHVDELAPAMTAAAAAVAGKIAVHVVDREADSVGHYREWDAAGHRFVVRGDRDRKLLWDGRECGIAAVAAALTYTPVVSAAGTPEAAAVGVRTGTVQAAEAAVVLHRPGKKTVPGQKTKGGHKKKADVPGPPLALRLVVTRVVAAGGAVLAEWFLLTNVPSSEADAATVGRWYAWRWRIETYHKLLKTAGMNAEGWQQESGAAWLRRVIVASAACLAVWHLQRDTSVEAGTVRRVLVRLSGRLMKRGVEATAPALLAGLEKLLAVDDLLQDGDIDLGELLAMVRRVLPLLFRPAREPGE